jgi:hypothetical protein
LSRGLGATQRAVLDLVVDLSWSPERHQSPEARTHLDVIAQGVSVVDELPSIAPNAARRAAQGLEQLGWLNISYETRSTPYRSPRWKSALADEGPKDAPPHPWTWRRMMMVGSPIGRTSPMWLTVIPPIYQEQFVNLRSRCEEFFQWTSAERDKGGGFNRVWLAEWERHLAGLRIQREMCIRNEVRWRDAVGSAATIPQGFMWWLISNLDSRISSMRQ